MIIKSLLYTLYYFQLFFKKKKKPKFIYSKVYFKNQSCVSDLSRLMDVMILINRIKLHFRWKCVGHFKCGLEIKNHHWTRFQPVKLVFERKNFALPTLKLLLCLYVFVIQCNFGLSVRFFFSGLKFSLHDSIWYQGVLNGGNWQIFKQNVETSTSYSLND